MIFELARPWALLLLLVPPLWVLLSRGAPRATVLSPRLAPLRGRRPAIRARLPAALRTLSWSALVVALAGPGSVREIPLPPEEGVSIVIAMDVSSSMLAEDFQPGNRLGAAKATLADFVAGRPRDRLGLVAFAAEPLTLVPVTTDHGMLLAVLGNVQVGMLEDGTAIGSGLAAAANRLRRMTGSRVIILLSDGENNKGAVNPRDAARAAAAHGIRVYTIGVGSNTRARIPVARTPTGLQYGFLPVRIDEPLLRDIASVSGGRYFRATDAAALQQVYAEIDRLVRTPTDGRTERERREWYLPLVVAAGVILLLEWTLRASRHGVLP